MLVVGKRCYKMMVVFREPASHGQLSSLLIREDGFLVEVPCRDGRVAAGETSPNEQDWRPAGMGLNYEPNRADVGMVRCYVLGVHRPLGGEQNPIHRVQTTFLADSLVDAPACDKLHGVRVDQQEFIVVTGELCLRAVDHSYGRQAIPAVCDRSGGILELSLEESIQLEQVISGPDVDATHSRVRVKGQVLKLGVISDKSGIKARGRGVGVHG